MGFEYFVIARNVNDEAILAVLRRLPWSFYSLAMTVEPHYSEKDFIYSLLRTQYLLLITALR